VLRVKFAALNPADRYLAEAQYPAKRRSRTSLAAMELAA
jgi:hypothetical protein